MTRCTFDVKSDPFEGPRWHMSNGMLTRPTFPISVYPRGTKGGKGGDITVEMVILIDDIDYSN